MHTNSAHRVQHRETGLYLMFEQTFTGQKAYWVTKLEWASRLSLSEAREAVRDLGLNAADYRICLR